MGWGSVVCHEVRFGRHGSVRCGLISRDSVKLGMAGPVGRDKVRWGVVWSGVVWQARSGWIRLGTVRCVQAGVVGSVRYG